MIKLEDLHSCYWCGGYTYFTDEGGEKLGVECDDCGAYTRDSPAVWNGLWRDSSALPNDLCPLCEHPNFTLYKTGSASWQVECHDCCVRGPVGNSSLNAVHRWYRRVGG